MAIRMSINRLRVEKYSFAFSNLRCFFNRYQTFEERVKPDWKDRKNIAFDLAKAVQ